MKTPEDDFFLGHTVLERKTVSREALLECLFQMSQERKAGVPRPLGILLVSHGHLAQEDLDRARGGPAVEEDPGAATAHGFFVA